MLRFIPQKFHSPISQINSDKKVLKADNNISEASLLRFPERKHQRQLKFCSDEIKA